MQYYFYSSKEPVVHKDYGIHHFTVSIGDAVVFPPAQFTDGAKEVLPLTQEL